MWNNTHDVLAAIHEAHRRLRAHESDAITAHAEARLLGAAAKMLALTLEHARLTNRLSEGSAVLPMMDFSIDGTPHAKLPDSAPAPKAIAS